MSDETAEQRAQRDAKALELDLKRLVENHTWPSTLVAGLRRSAAEQLVTWGWTRLGPNEKVITPMSRAEAFETVKLALEHWESLKNEVKRSAEVSSDSSELTSGVKDERAESLILAAFAGGNRPLSYAEACEMAAGTPIRFFPSGPWHLWNAAFRSLEDRGLIEPVPHVEGKITRYVLTQAGRGLHKLDGVEL